MDDLASAALSCEMPVQILPQLLNHLGQDEEQEDALDFGAIAIYSCEGSCQGPRSYLEEFVWVQPP